MNKYNYISDDLIKNFDITDQLIQNNPANTDTLITNYINLIINNYRYNNSYVGNKKNGYTNGNNINVYNNYNDYNRLVTDTTVRETQTTERFLDYYHI